MIGRTLFWYIFRDLMKIFFMANGALAGIMSFGGLLRPLTHQGLDVAQIGKLLGYFNMAMLTYSMPIAALFATTVVYGRLSADNELTGCRAGGLSHLSVAFPAFAMGIVVALLSLVFLCFIVPIFTMKAEQTLYTNLAKLIAGKIQSQHQIDFGAITIYAQDAYIPESADAVSGQQAVVLKGPTIETVERPYKNDREYQIPKDFYTASEAIIYIEQRDKGEQRGSGKVYLTVHLEDGVKFPREFRGAMTASIETTDYGPIEMDSPVKEDTRFMDVWRLKRLYEHPATATRVKRLVEDFVERDQQNSLAEQVASELNESGTATFRFANGEAYVLHREANSPGVYTRGGEVVLPAGPPTEQLSAWTASQTAADAATTALGLPPVPAMPMPLPSDRRPITFSRQIAGQSPPVISAREAHLQIRPSGDPATLRLTLELIDTVSHTSTGIVQKKNFIQPFTVPINGEAQKIATQGAAHYLNAHDPLDRQRIGRELLSLSNNILAESHSRVSFAISCLVLVMVGCALGMMFRSGNFLSAFAVSFIPALITITLIVAGQRLAGNIPQELKTELSKYSNSPLSLGLGLIWAGNCVNFVLAAGLLGRLQRK